MKEVFLGEVIRQRRLELGLTQEQLCIGICEPMTISRFENGHQTPSRNRIKALLQRLGLPDDRFYGLLSEKELQISALETDITSCHVRFERASPEEQQQIRQECLDKHRVLESVIDKDDNLSRQLILRSRCLLYTELRFEEKLSILIEAMHLTSPNFDLDHISLGLYSEQEIKLINAIASCYIRAGKHNNAIDILKQLLLYLQTNLQKLPPCRAHIPMVAYNYARELEIVERYEEAIVIGEYARTICIDYGHYRVLPNVLAILAKCRYHQGDYERSSELYKQSFYIYKAIEDSANSKIIQSEAQNLLSLDLE